MERLTKISDGIDHLLTKIGKIAAWSGVALIAVTVFDVITRRFLVLGSTKLQEMEWHFHVILFAFCIGFAYMKDAHVRIDLIRERLGEKAQWWIELVGCVLFLLPYCGIVVYFGYFYTVQSFLDGEISASATGLGYRWIIKSTIPIGFTLLGLAGFAVVLRKIVELFGPPELRARVHDIEEAEAEPLIEATIEATIRKHDQR